MSHRKQMPCLEGRPHQWSHSVDGSAWEMYKRTCARCRETVYDCWVNCGYDCGPQRDETYTRYRDRPVTWQEYQDGIYYAREWVEDKGTCEWCLEKHRRDDAKRARQIDPINDEWRAWQRHKAREAAQEERREQWLVLMQQYQARSQQLKSLREGHATLTAIRRVLRGADPLPKPESTPGRTSPTL